MDTPLCPCGATLGRAAQLGMLRKPELCPKCQTARHCRHMLAMLPVPDEREWNRLNEFEQEFVPSVRQQLESKGVLSERQVEVLERIYARHQ